MPSEEDLKEKGLTFPENYILFIKKNKNAYSSNHNMTKDFNDLITLVEQSFKDTIKENCPKENAIIDTILSNKYGKGNLVDNPHSVNIPWESNIETWPDSKELVECDNIVKLYNTIKDNNLPKYGEEYQKVVEGCNNKMQKKSFKDYTKRS